MLISPYCEEHVPQVRAFNERLQRAGSSFQFGAQPSQSSASSSKTHEIRSEHFLAIDDGGCVRGAYALAFHHFMIGGIREQVAFLQIPISEGSVNPAFGAVGLFLVKDAMRRSPLLFGLGMGGIDHPLPRLFRALGARVCEVAFFFQVLRPRAFLKNAAAFRATAYLRTASQVAAMTGVADIAVAAINALKRRGAMPRRHLRIESVSEFPVSTDETWKIAAPKYSFISIRDHQTLNHLYSSRDPRFHRLLVYENGNLVGWALATDSQMRDHNHFGDMRVAAIVNCLARPGHEDAVINGATYYLRDRGVDLIVSNQLHPDWQSALHQAGYLTYSSNFVLAIAPALRDKLKMLQIPFERIHINRGDGDGPYNL